ncbi:Hypothetical protein NGK_1766 [Neisseria gonorrhoeae NCCP11945]|uniref:Uncharacterized protein n=1 Tax=Neisseria gonorrhoeae (strain NCCP11945) TaxID=521006 RepID=B4RPA6_NEIG2|nr:Hypothetical protein NGK_1766 [Neisseria gonorrhoeae NCCP11945]
MQTQSDIGLIFLKNYPVSKKGGGNGRPILPFFCAVRVSDGRIEKKGLHIM